MAHGVRPSEARARHNYRRGSTQVIYSTLFVGLDRCDQIRLLRKADDVSGKPRITKAVKVELDAVSACMSDTLPGGDLPATPTGPAR